MDIINVEISDIVDQIQILIESDTDIINVEISENTDIITVSVVDVIQEIAVSIQSDIDIINVEISDIGIQGIQGIVGNIIEIVATENIPAFSLVNGDGTIANSNTVNKRDKAVAISTTTILNGFSGYAVAFGFVENPLWTWTPGNILYLNLQI